MSYRGTPAWMAPEMLRGSADRSSKVDVWSFGIILWELLTRQVPYHKWETGWLTKLIEK